MEEIPQSDITWQETGKKISDTSLVLVVLEREKNAIYFVAVVPAFNKKVYTELRVRKKKQ